MPETSPITRHSLGYRRVAMTAMSEVLVGSQTYEAPQLLDAVTVEATLRSPEQLDPEISKVMGQVVGLIQDSRLEILLEQTAERLHHLDDALHAVRYHQQQFLFRLRVIDVDLSLMQPPTGNVKLDIDDMPLRYELEALIVRTRTALDTLARALFALVGNSKQGRWGDLAKARGVPRKARRPVQEVLERHQRWLSIVRESRDAIVHEAAFDTYRGVAFKLNLPKGPALADLSAEALALDLWRSLLTMTLDLFEVFAEAGPVEPVAQGE